MVFLGIFFFRSVDNISFIFNNSLLSVVITALKPIKNGSPFLNWTDFNVAPK